MTLFAACSLAACDAPCEAHGETGGTMAETGETGSGVAQAGALDADRPLVCDWPGDVVPNVPWSNGLCADCICGPEGELEQCSGLYPCP